MQLLTTGWRDLVRRVGRPMAVLLAISIAGLGLALLLGWGFAEVYESVLAGTGIAGLDMPVLMAMVATRTPAREQAVTWFTNTAGTVGMPIIGIVGSVAIALYARRTSPVILTVIAGLGSLALTISIKSLVGRPRPPLADAVPPYETSMSFPSGHALNAIVIVGILVYCLVCAQRSRWARVLTVVIGGTYAIAVGLSRVWLGHHWLSDVIGAWLLGLCWLTIVIVAHRIARVYVHRDSAIMNP